MSTAIILLAAGSSSRLGQSKQLLKINGITLLEKAITIALQTSATRVIVVLGSDEDIHRKKIDAFPVEIILNPNWKNGMGSSIKSGLKCLLLSSPDIDAVIIMVCDQPLLDASHLENLIKHFHENKNDIIASKYSDTIGVPVLFSHSTFKKLLRMDDGHGAKSIIENHKEKTKALDFPQGDIDIDTMEDYNNLISEVSS